MSQPADPRTVAGSIIDSNVYLVLGTADGAGYPWISPVYFAHSRYEEFYWISSPEAKHSRNLARRPSISIVIFDSQIAIGAGQAVYMSAEAEELAGTDIESGLATYNGRFPNPAERGLRLIQAADVRAPALYRLYRAVASEYWVLDSDAHPDRRIRVKMQNNEAV